MTKFHSDFLYRCDPDFERLGFNRGDFMKLLNASGTAAAGPEQAKWEQGLFLRQWFTIDEAACIICGRHPDEMEDWWGEQWPRSVVSMRQAILDAWRELDIDTDGCGDVQNHHRVSHPSIKTWCEQRGISWPLVRGPQAQPVAGAADAANFAHRLAEAELKAERLAQDLAATTAERDKLRHELQGLTDDLVSAKKEAAQSQADLKQARADLLQGKSRTSALKLVGGMALAVYKIPIKSGRLTGLAELRKDLDSVGVAISEDVIRSHLNAAAEVI